MKAALEVLESPQGRDFLKTAIVARMYSGGANAMHHGLLEHMKGLEGFNLTGSAIDTLVHKILLEHMYNGRNVTEIRIIDSVIGMDSAKRDKIATWMAQQFTDKYNSETPLHTQLVTSADDIIANAKQGTREMIEKGMHIRLKRIAEASVPRHDRKDSAGYEARIAKEVVRLKKKYNGQLEMAERYIQTLPNKKVETKEQWRKVNIIMSGDATIATDIDTKKEVIINEAWKDNRMLAALNVYNNTPRAIRDEAIAAAIKTQGYEVEPGDLMGYEKFNLFASTLHDLTSQRLYQGFEAGQYGTTHQGPSTSKFASEEKPQWLMEVW